VRGFGGVDAHRLDRAGFGRNGAEKHAKPFSFANRPSEHGVILSFVARGSIGSEEWRRAWRRESRLLARVRRAAWRREMAELERTWAIASAHAEGVSIRKIAAAGGLGPTRVHAIVRDVDIDSLDAALGKLRSLYGWPAPEDPDASRDDELSGRELIAQRLGDEVEWLRDCANWLAQLELGEYPPVINLRPEADHPDRCNIVVDLGRVRRVLLRIAADIDELAHARSVEELENAQANRDVRAERRRRLAESPLGFPAHGRSSRQYQQALYDFEKERWRRGEADSHPFDRDIYPP
jgi:hypothetical protein